MASIWEHDTCGYLFGDRATIAHILNQYTNNPKMRLTTTEITRILGQPDEIRTYSNIHWYYHIRGFGKCDKSMPASYFTLDISIKRKRIMGSSIYLLEPEDN